MHRGTVKWFNAEKGYGFIQQESGGPDIFVHYSGIDGTGYRQLVEGDPVVFDLVEGPRGPAAQGVKVDLHAKGR